MKIILNLLVNGLAVAIAAYLLPGVHLDSFFTAVMVAVVLAVVNLFIKPIILLLTLPVTIFTFGLFIFVINGLMVLLASTFVPGFRVENFVWAMAFSIVLWAVNLVLHTLTK